MVQVALRVEVSTLSGALEGVPALLRLFDTYGVQASFLFSLGRDHSGRALGRMLRPDYRAQARRLASIRQAGLKPLFYGTLFPGPDLARRGRAVMRDCAAAGHEVGIQGFDRVAWEGGAAFADEAWTARALERAVAAFEAVFGRRPAFHGASGWQINPQVLALEGRLGFDFASDTRGRSPFYPVLQGVRSACPQIPTSLPTLDELIGRDGVTEDNAHQYLYAESRYVAPQGHVYSAQADLEGLRLLPVLEKLLVMWRAPSGEVGCLGDVYRGLDLARLPHHQIGWGQVPGRPGYLAMQGRQVPD